MTADRYAIEARGSRVTIKAFAGGLLSVMGHNPVIGARDVSGEIHLTPGSPRTGTVRVRIGTASLSVENDASDKDRREMERAMRDEVLEVAAFPEIVFDGSETRIDATAEGRLRVDMVGELSLHGVTRRQRVAAQVFVTGDVLRVQGEATLRQTDFGIRLVSAAGGSLKIKDDVTCGFDLVARRTG
jgi:polyisoprenoid-binding protein YceI